MNAPTVGAAFVAFFMAAYVAYELTHNSKMTSASIIPIAGVAGAGFGLVGYLFFSLLQASVR